MTDSEMAGRLVLLACIWGWLLLWVRHLMR